MKVPSLSLAALTLSSALASEVYWTNNADLFHQLDVHTAFANFTENTKHLSSDGQGLKLEGVLFHDDVPSEEQDSLEDSDESSIMRILPRGQAKFSCMTPTCSGVGPGFYNDVQQNAFGSQVCPLLKKYGKYKAYGGLAAVASGATCQGGVKNCYLVVGLGFIFNQKDLVHPMTANCGNQISSLSNYCGGVSGQHICQGGPKKGGSLVTVTMNTQTEKVTCKTFVQGKGAKNEHCKSIKCDGGNNNCQTF